VSSWVFGTDPFPGEGDIAMAVLHGSWVFPSQTALEGEQQHDLQLTDSYFLLWGETWRTGVEPVQIEGRVQHPYALSSSELVIQLNHWVGATVIHWPDEIMDVLQDAKPRSRKGSSRQAETAAFTQLGCLAQWTESGLMPLHSGAEIEPDEALCLSPFQVSGLQLTAPQAIALLLSLPLHATVPESEHWMGDDLKFWFHVARWALDLTVRGKVLPQVAAHDGTTAIAVWQPLLDGAVDQTRFMHFSQQMPLACRFYQRPTADIGNGLLLPEPASALLMQGLQQLLNALVHCNLAAACQPDSQRGHPWLAALAHPTGTFQSSPAEIEALSQSLESWQTPLQSAIAAQRPFRTCFELIPPQQDALPWYIVYGLQATTDPQLWVRADAIWSQSTLKLRNLTLDNPQETLLAGLGLASRIDPLIETSLQGARPVQHTLTPQQAYEFLKTTVWRLEDSGFGVILPDSLANREGWANRLGLQIRATAPQPGRTSISLNSLLDFRWELTIGGQSLSQQQFEQLIALNSPLVEINGEWVELRPQDIRAAQAFFANRQNQPGLSLQDALRLSTGDTLLLDKLPIVQFEATGALEELLNALGGNQTLEAIPAPVDFQGTLRPYQARGVGWLSFLERWNLGACLADDMGLGKTIQLIAFLLHAKTQKRMGGAVLLVCPTSVLGNWEREIRRFAPTLKVLVHHGSGRAKKREFAKAAQHHDVVLTSYSLVHRDESLLGTIDWEGVVLDEAQNIKNAEARQSQAVRKLQTHCRIALTGTPLENRLSELWSILDFLNPGYLGSQAFFQKRFATPIERFGDTASLQTLRSLVQPFILRRTKTDRDIIQDLPEKLEMPVFCNLTPEQATLYEKTVQQSLEAVDAAEGIQRRGIILATLTKLKQICNHPAQFLKEESLNGTPQRSGKLKRLEEMLEEILAEGDRTLIFTQFAEMGKLLQSHLEKVFNRDILLLYGGTTKNKREEMIDRFQNDPQGPRIFILSLKAGGVGLNLTRANHVFHFDRWWNPAVENQATDRAFRIGQTRNVQVHKFVCGGTLEEKIHDMIESKKALAEQVVGAGENWLTDLDTNQLRNLLLLDRTSVIDEET
jgi:SNF2 family DNA or RNA helicase